MFFNERFRNRALRYEITVCITETPRGSDKNKLSSKNKLTARLKRLPFIINIDRYKHELNYCADNLLRHYFYKNNDFTFTVLLVEQVMK